MPSASDALDTRLSFAFALAALAGGVDAIAVLSLGDVFVSFMSGNTTMLGNALAHLQGGHALRLASVVLVFLAGVVVGEVLAVRAAARRRPTQVLATVAFVLSAAALLSWREVDHFPIALCLAAAMGVQNAAVRRAGGMDVALTYVTGTLVRLGRALAAASLGRGEWKSAAPIAGLWLAFAVGAIAGGLAVSASRSVAIAISAGCAAALALHAAWRSPASAGASGRLGRSVP